MTSPRYLSRSTYCQHCHGGILAGTPLKALSWDATLRLWSHWKPSCEEVGPSPPAPESLQAPKEQALPTDSGRTGSRGPRDPGPRNPGPSALGSWSVTLETHVCQDPALSKTVLRLARLHLESFEDACEVAERLRGELRLDPQALRATEDGE